MGEEPPVALQELDRDLAVQLGIVRGTDHSHPALSQLGEQDVPAQLLPLGDLLLGAPGSTGGPTVAVARPSRLQLGSSSESLWLQEAHWETC